MMPPNGACRSVANALSQASRRFAPWPTPQGFVCLRIASVGASFRNSAIKCGRRRQVQDIVVGKFLAVELLENIRGICRRGPRSGAGFRRSARVAPAARKSSAPAGNAAWSGGKFLLQMRGNGGVVGGGARKNLGGQLAAQFQRSCCRFRKFVWRLPHNQAGPPPP